MTLNVSYPILSRKAQTQQNEEFIQFFLSANKASLPDGLIPDHGINHANERYLKHRQQIIDGKDAIPTPLSRVPLAILGVKYVTSLKAYFDRDIQQYRQLSVSEAARKVAAEYLQTILQEQTTKELMTLRHAARTWLNGYHTETHKIAYSKVISACTEFSFVQGNLAHERLVQSHEISAAMDENENRANATVDHLLALAISMAGEQADKNIDKGDRFS